MDVKPIIFTVLGITQGMYNREAGNLGGHSIFVRIVNYFYKL